MANYEKTGTFTHVDESGNTYELYPQTKAEMVEGLSLFGPVTTAGTGAAYTATVNGITELKVGVKLTIIPHTVSTSLTPTLNVNNLGAKYIRMPGTYNTGTAANAPVASWLVANKPVTVTWDGTQWETDVMRPAANSLSGTVAIANGGTGATDAAGALNNLGAAAKSDLDEYLKLSGGVMTSDTVRLSNGYVCIGGNETFTFMEAITSIDNNDNARQLRVYNQNSDIDIEKSLKFYDMLGASGYKEYNIFGEHNKPTGTYVGNGSATGRTISIGGIGECLFIKSNVGCGFIGASGGIFWRNAEVKAISNSAVLFKDGKLSIISTSEYLNQSNTTYEYYVL